MFLQVDFKKCRNLPKPQFSIEGKFFGFSCLVKGLRSTNKTIIVTFTDGSEQEFKKTEVERFIIS